MALSKPITDVGAKITHGRSQIEIDLAEVDWADTDALFELNARVIAEDEKMVATLEQNGQINAAHIAGCIKRHTERGGIRNLREATQLYQDLKVCVAPGYPEPELVPQALELISDYTTRVTSSKCTRGKYLTKIFVEAGDLRRKIERQKSYVDKQLAALKQ